MRMIHPKLWVPVLALLAFACAPHGPQGGHGMPCDKHGPCMAMGPGRCGPGACAYREGCFSNGAEHWNAGLCQECRDGQWVIGNGCREAGAMMGEKPCDHDHEHHDHRQHHHRRSRQ